MREGWSGSLGLADANSYIEWINSKVLLYSTGNYIQYPVINHNVKEKNKTGLQRQARTNSPVYETPGKWADSSDT